jgi:hypothetical protein
MHAVSHRPLGSCEPQHLLVPAAHSGSQTIASATHPAEHPSATAVVGGVLSSPVYVDLYWDANWDPDNPSMPKDGQPGATRSSLPASRR